MDWQGVINNPFLQDLPFKIELNKFGQILMTPASNRHGATQIKVARFLDKKMSGGEVIAKCSIQTSDGVKVADVAWASDDFIARNAYATPYPEAPEICIEVTSPSNSKDELKFKTELYLAKGAKEVWVVDENLNVNIYVARGEVKVSPLTKGEVIL